MVWKCKIYKLKIFLSRERGYSFLWIPITCSHSPLQLGMYQENYWCFLIPTFIFPFVKSFIWLNYYKSIKKWSEIVSREVQKSKKFPTQGKGTPLPLNPIPHSLNPTGLDANTPAESLSPSGLCQSGCSHLSFKISGSQPLFNFLRAWNVIMCFVQERGNCMITKLEHLVLTNIRRN